MKTIELLMISVTVLTCGYGLYMSYINHQDAKRLKIERLLIQGTKSEKKEETLAQKLHEYYGIEEKIEDIIFDAFAKFEPDIVNQLDFRIGSDWYDNSIEIYFKNSLPYPYEPCFDIRKAIYSCGFNSVYWNFLADKDGGNYDEVRNYEPRHERDSSKWKFSKYGYVDGRFNEDEYVSKYRSNHDPN